MLCLKQFGLHLRQRPSERRDELLKDRLTFVGGEVLLASQNRPDEVPGEEVLLVGRDLGSLEPRPNAPKNPGNVINRQGGVVGRENAGGEPLKRFDINRHRESRKHQRAGSGYTG